MATQEPINNTLLEGISLCKILKSKGLTLATAERMGIFKFSIIATHQDAIIFSTLGTNIKLTLKEKKKRTQLPYLK